MRSLLLVTVVTVAISPTAHAVTHEWTRILATNRTDTGRGVSPDGLGSVYLTGTTSGTLGEMHAGLGDAFIAKYDESGTREWLHQFGTSAFDVGLSVSADGLGSFYVVGETGGTLDGARAGGEDAFIAKYYESGEREWIHQFGTTSNESAQAVSLDGLGNIYVSGITGGSLDGANAGRADVFIRKYAADGSIEWAQQFGTGGDENWGVVSSDGLGNVYLSGSTTGAFAGTNAGDYDAFVTKYDASGALQWTQQFGTSRRDVSRAVSADGLGNVYIAGSTTGSLVDPNAGLFDGFVAKYDATGDRQWIRQISTAGEDWVRGLSADGLGNVYVSGQTEGSLEGVNGGDFDAFVIEYDASGTINWIVQSGGEGWDTNNCVSADGLGSIYTAGDVFVTVDAHLTRYTTTLPALLGDVNLDGEVNGLDVDPFVDVLLNGTNDNATQIVADMNDDGSIDGLDVESFVAAVVGGGTQPVPEPSAGVLALIALGLIAGRLIRHGVC